MTLPDEPSAAFADARRFYSQQELAAMLKRSVRQIRRWEAGETTPDPLIVPALRTAMEDTTRVGRGAFKFIDLFAGIGGMRKGFESIGGECVYTSEWDKNSQITYKHNFRDTHEIHGDITLQQNKEAIPEHDVLLAGFPCQPFSLAGVSKKNSLGKKHGFEDATQGTLFFDICKIIEQHRPKAFLLENVKNLRSHDKGKTFEVIKRALTEELGYRISYRVIDARHWVPQHRERIFIVGFRDPTPFDLKTHFFAEERDEDLFKKQEKPRIGSILHKPDEEAEKHFTISKRNKTVPADRYTLSDHLWGYLQAYAAKHKAKGNGFGCTVVDQDDVARTLSARYHKDGSEILVSNGRKNPRRLTPRECARLMGFDSDGQEPFKIEVSDTQAYRQFGNSVAVPVIKAIAGAIRPFITSGSQLAR